MSQNFYREIHLHTTWHTILSRPLLTEALEPLVHRALKQKIINTPGVYVHEIGGTATHIHLAAAMSSSASARKTWIGFALTFATKRNITPTGKRSSDWNESIAKNIRALTIMAKAHTARSPVNEAQGYSAEDKDSLTRHKWRA